MTCHTYLYACVITAPLRGIITALLHRKYHNMRVPYAFYFTQVKGVLVFFFLEPKSV